MSASFFFYDLETSGLNPQKDRIMQFAGQRTNLDFEPIGEPVNLLVELQDDTLPSPSAIMVTGITPQMTKADGIPEREFCRFVVEEMATPETTIIGYNSVRFDDEFMRATLWRNFHDAYAWQWRNGRSRWDLLDVVRMTRALRPEGINWPVTDEGRATNRLELLTKQNGIEHEHAHDALADVVALIEVSKLIKQHQPQLFDYLYKMRQKKPIGELVNLARPAPFVYASGRYPSKFEKTTIAYPLAPAANRNILVYDLRYNLDELLDFEQNVEEYRLAEDQDAKEFTLQNADLPKNPNSSKDKHDTSQKANQPDSAKEKCPKFDHTKLPDGMRSLAQAGILTDYILKRLSEGNYFPIVKKMQYNRCPAVAPLGVLSKADGWSRIGFSEEMLQKNLESLRHHPDFAARMERQIKGGSGFSPGDDPESQLYDGGFLDSQDLVYMEAVRNNGAEDLADFHPPFVDERLPELLLHYKAKNFPSSLTSDETAKWEQYRCRRLSEQVPKFLAELQKIQASLTKGEIISGHKNSDCEFYAGELMLWYQSLLPGDE